MDDVYRNDLNVEKVLEHPTLNHTSNLVLANLIVHYPVTEEMAHPLCIICNYEWSKVKKAGEMLLEGIPYHKVRAWAVKVRGIDL
jgi:hypothetical protein